MNFLNFKFRICTDFEFKHSWNWNIFEFEHYLLSPNIWKLTQKKKVQERSSFASCTATTKSNSCLHQQAATDQTKNERADERASGRPSNCAPTEAVNGPSPTYWRGTRRHVIWRKRRQIGALIAGAAIPRLLREGIAPAWELSPNGPSQFGPIGRFFVFKQILDVYKYILNKKLE
jgi:hypothetical protein